MLYELLQIFVSLYKTIKILCYQTKDTLNRIKLTDGMEWHVMTPQELDHHHSVKRNLIYKMTVNGQTEVHLIALTAKELFMLEVYKRLYIYYCPFGS